MGLLALANGRTLVQEGNPLPMLWAAAHLELPRAEIVPVTADGRKLISRSHTGHQPLTRYLTQQGWTFIDQMGAGLFYARASATLLVQSRMWTRRYQVYELASAP